ncbi:MAG TPA: hypothetical protein VM120_09245 [Bryobacteraceae bacterium]|nr:hypothetical protein [Bryobacteraceae bacterium]
MRVAAPKLHFLNGKTVDAVRSGRAIALDFQFSIMAGTLVLKRALERFVISYDLWEEKYAVTRLGVRKAQSNLTQEKAEAWCLENLSVATDGVSADRLVTVNLEIREHRPEAIATILTEPGISLYGLIEIFSRPARSEQLKWRLQSGPIRLHDVRNNGS